MGKESPDDAPILNPLAFLLPLFRAVVTIVMAVLGAYLFGMLGSMTYPGIGVIAGSLLGFFFFGILTCCVIGAYKDCLPDINALFDTSAVVPPALHHVFYRHGKFTLIITVHRIEGLSGMGGLLPWSNPDTYVSIECGDNPIKRTCVKGTLKYEEQFRLTINARDEHVVIKALDQDIFGAALLGYLNLDIDEDIIGHGFPQEQTFKLEMGGKGDKTGGKTVIVMSFDYTDDFPAGLQAAHVKNFPTMAQRRRERLARSQEQWQKNYGACNQLEGLTFSHDMNATVAAQKAAQEELSGANKKKKKDAAKTAGDPESTHPPPETQV